MWRAILNIRHRVAVGIIASIILPAAFSEGQNSPKIEQQRRMDGQRADEDSRIRIGVEEVRLDVVVLDSKGRQMTELTEKDFEIFQEGKPQKIIACKYYSDYEQGAGEIQRKRKIENRDGMKIIPPRITRESVRRTIVFLVDDCSMRKITEIERARMCIRKYVEKQMQPGDLVAILQTYRGTSALSAFTSHSREILKRVENIHWKAPYDFPGGRIGEEYISLYMAVDYCIRSLKDMPGRKYLMLMSLNVNDVGHVDGMYNRMADSAMRAGVVIHTLDIMGLADAIVDAEPIPVSIGRSHSNPGPIRDVVYSQIQVGWREKFRRLPLSQKTGGVFLTGSNYFINGIKDLEEEMKGYYLLSYIPPESKSDRKDKLVYNRIKVKVKKPGCQVHTRDGFIELNKSLETPAEASNPLIKAMFSPFQYKDLDVSMASGYVWDGNGNYNLQAWAYLDGNDVNITNEANGGHSVSLEAIAATTDIDGMIQDSAKRQVHLSLSDAEVQWVRDNGLKFALSLNKDKPGAYYVRVAIKDRISGSIGSAYEFLEIPDINKGSLALSSIVILNSKEDEAWIHGDAGENDHEKPVEARKAANKSQAFRRYRPGEGFSYATIVYNSKSKIGMAPDLESEYALFMNGEEVYKGKPEPLQIGTSGDTKRIKVQKNIVLQNTLLPGEYNLQLLIRDKNAKGKNSTAMQSIQFEVIPN